MAGRLDDNGLRIRNLDLIGRQLGDYVIEAPLGRGAMGTVYRATSVATGAPCAVKVMATPEDNPDPVLAARFEREITILAKFDHPNVVRNYGASEAAGVRYYAMELVEGESLETLLVREGSLHPDTVLAYCVQLCDALEHIHRYGIVHRDLKPANVMVTPDGTIKLTDFGIAKDLSALQATQLTKADHTVGTIAYMSPEQLGGTELTRRSDLYSLGILMYRMLTGRLPFIGENVFEYMNQRMAGAFPLPSAVNRAIPAEFDGLVKQLLMQDPFARPFDAHVVKERLLDLQRRLEQGGERSDFGGDVELGETVVLASSIGKERRPEVTEPTVDAPKPRRLVEPVPARTSIFDSTPFLVACLVGLGALAAYLLWPLGPEALFQHGQALMASDRPEDWDRAMKMYLEPLMERYPDNPYRAEVEEFRKKVEIERARRRARVARIRGARDEAGAAERLYILANNAEYAGETARARSLCQQLIDTYERDGSQHAWVFLAREKIAELDDSQSPPR